MSPQEFIAHYRIVCKLGEGGMGAVYRATDTKLNRDVAIKVLPPAFAEDAARMQRFEREAQVLASLNHPNIAAIYGIEQGAIVMELVEGEDLKGRVPVETALDYARQIAAGLEAAHEKGIVHRDLKPANIKVTAGGTVKILDFGLAKATETSAAVWAGATQSPTLSLARTQAGMILGTAAYMSPEQARGKPVDKRADIWAFGVVLFEMLSGASMFAAGDTVTDIIAAVVTLEPDWSALPRETPPHIRRLVLLCLRKDPKQRLRDIGDARIALEEPAAPHSAAPAPPVPASRLPWMISAGLAAALAAAGLLLWRAARQEPRPLVRTVIEIPEQEAQGPIARFWPILSPDGRRIAFAGLIDGKNQLATRTLDQARFTPLPDTVGAAQPFFSPDGRWIAFFDDGKLKKISVEGGAAMTICSAPSPRGGWWGENGEIVLVPQVNGGFMRVSSAGGSPEPLIRGQEQQSTDVWPQVLPGGRAVLFTSKIPDGGNFTGGLIVAMDLRTGLRKVLRDGGNYGRYSSSGHLLYHHDNVLFAAPMNLGRLELSGPPFPALEGLSSSMQGSAEYDVAGNGSAVYTSGAGLSANWSIFSVDREGKVSALSAPARRYVTPRLSPDGGRLALSATEGVGSELSLLDLRRDALVKLTSLGGRVAYPVWSPDGKHILFAANAGGVPNLYVIRSDASTPAVRISESKNVQAPSDIAPDGKSLIYWESAGDRSRLWIAPLDLSISEHPTLGKAELLLNTATSESDARISPDGHWLAYTSTEGGGTQVYVRPYPPAPSGGKWQISTDGGRFPVWSHAGNEIAYMQQFHLFTVSWRVEAGGFVAEKPRPWPSDSNFFTMGVLPNFDLTPDGKHAIGFYDFALREFVKPFTGVNLLLNFGDELRRRSPGS